MKPFFYSLFLLIAVLVSCNGTHPCEEGGVPCEDGVHCIGIDEWCNERPDCPDESDEEFCKFNRRWSLFSANDCPEEKYFECGDGPCVPLVTQCDGSKNCKDGSDEKDCPAEGEIQPEIEESKPAESETESGKTASNGDEKDSRESSTQEPTISEDSKPSGTDVSSSSPDPKVNTSSSKENSHSNAQHLERSNEDRSKLETSVTPTSTTVKTNPTALPHRTEATTRSHRTPVTPPYSRPGGTYSPHGQPYTYYYDTRSDQSIYYDPSTPHIVRLRGRFVCTPAQQPRGPVNYQQSSQKASNGREKPRTIFPPFHFEKNYTRIVGQNYLHSMEKARRWIIKQRGDSYEWGEDTPRAVVALSLIASVLLPEDPENDLMTKMLATHLGVKLVQQRRNPANRMSVYKLASYINALVATCQDPYQFMEQNLTAVLLDMTKNRTLTVNSINPMMHITMCLVGADIRDEDLHTLIHLVIMQTEDENIIDRQILATTALACVQQQQRFKDFLKPYLEAAVRQIFHRRAQKDGSFGGVYRTALAAQALMSMRTNITEPWDVMKTLDFLANQQKTDGSFGDMLATYLTVPVLSGRSLLHLRNTRCDPVPPQNQDVDVVINASGQMKQIMYALKVDNPPKFSISISFGVPKSFSILDIMKKAEDLNREFRFSYDEYLNTVDVYTISGIPNDSERGYRWRLYILNANKTFLDLRRDENSLDLHKIIPRDCDELLFWYLRDL